MRVTIFLLVAVSGFGMMLWSYFGLQQIDGTVPWAWGGLYVPTDDPGDDWSEPDFEHTQVLLRLLPVGPFGELLLAGLSATSPDLVDPLEYQFADNLIQVSSEDAVRLRGALAEGRLPAPESNEVLAGHRATRNGNRTVDDRELRVVGVLRRDAAVLADSLIAVEGTLLDDLFESDDVGGGWLVQLSPAQIHDRTTLDRLAKAFPAKQFLQLAPGVHVERGPYYLYLGGQTLLLLGGSGFLIALYGILQKRIRSGPLKVPLDAMSSRPRLLWTVHLVYFGLAMLAALVVYELPMLQTLLLQVTGATLSGESGPLAQAATAYRSGNVLWAATVTFVVNFCLGSVAEITLPSLVIPGIGVLLALVRAGLWGLLLAPTTNALSGGMLPHSWTMLLEGEGYILATFFAALVPLYLLGHGTEGGFWNRFRQACLVNLKGNILVAVVLLIAGCYEAVEVIAMMRQ